MDNTQLANLQICLNQCSLSIECKSPKLGSLPYKTNIFKQVGSGNKIDTIFLFIFPLQQSPICANVYGEKGWSSCNLPKANA